MSETTLKFLKDLAEKLGTTGEHLWGVLVRQAPISSIAACAALLACAIGSILCLHLGVKAARKALKATYGDEEPWIALCVTLIGSGIALLIAFLCNLSDLPLILSGFFNPEYWAFKQLH